MEFMVIWLLCAIFSGVIARHKNRNATNWFWFGLLSGPFGLVLLALFFPKIDYEFVNFRDTN